MMTLGKRYVEIIYETKGNSAAPVNHNTRNRRTRPSRNVRENVEWSGYQTSELMQPRWRLPLHFQRTVNSH
jgi:hypothetical protein